MAQKGIPTHKPKTMEGFRKLNNDMMKRGFMAIDALRPGTVHDITLLQRDNSDTQAKDMAAYIGNGEWSKGPLSRVAWSFDTCNDSTAVTKVLDDKGKEMGLGYVAWGPNNSIPSVIPPLAMSSPYTSAPLRYIADLTVGLGVRLMNRMPDGKLMEFRDAGEILYQALRAEIQKAKEEGAAQGGALIDITTYRHDGVTAKAAPETQEPDSVCRARDAYNDWYMTWYGYDEPDGNEERDEKGNIVKEGTFTHVPGAKEFLENNNLDLHFMQCEQDDVMLDIYFPTVGLEKGRKGSWKPKIVEVSMLPAHSTRLEKMNEYRHINHVYFSDLWRTQGAGARVVIPESSKIKMYPACMPQNLLKDLRYLVSSNQRTTPTRRPTWIVCPTYYPSGQKPYYPQPTWWSVFTSKAFDFSSTILYDKAKQRENSTSWGKIFYISLDYLNQVFADEGYAGNQDKQDEFIADLEKRMEDFLQHRENHGKMMRQWMWEGKDGKEHHSIEIADVTEISNEMAKAGKEELELSTNPIFLALQVDPRDVGVPMVSASNGGTALREIRLMKQQQLNPKQRLYLQFMNTVARFNDWSERAEFHIVQQSFTTLDRSNTGTVQTIAGEGA